MLCSKGDKDDEQKKWRRHRSCSRENQQQSMSRSSSRRWRNRQRSMSKRLRQLLEDSEDDNWDLVRLPGVLAIARRTRKTRSDVLADKEYKEDKKKLLKDMKEFHAGKVAEKAAAEEPEEQPKASGSRARWRRLRRSRSRENQQQRRWWTSSRSKRACLRQLLED